jgi:hypothetical protein
MISDIIANLLAKYSGTMTKQSIDEIDKLLNDLCNKWDLTSACLIGVSSISMECHHHENLNLPALAIVADTGHCG